MVDWLPGGSTRRLRRALDRLGMSIQPDPATYREALFLALRLDPPRAMEVWRAYDARIPADRYAAVFRPDDAQRLAGFAAQPDRNVLRVVFEVADRLRLDGPRRAARDRLADVLTGDADALIFQLRRWYETGALDAELMSRVVQAHTVRVPLRHDAPQWVAFLERLPAALLPDLFDVRCLLGQCADAVRLADTPAREQEAIDCCAESSRLDDIEAGLGLADRRGDQQAVLRLQERAGDVLAAAGRFAEALERYVRSDRTDRVSECHERLGQLAEALATCPADQPDRLADLAGRCRPELDALVEREAFDEAARSATRLLTELDRATPVTDAVEARRTELRGLRTAVLAAGGDHFAVLVRRAAPDDRPGIYREWSRFAEAAGEPAEAARLAELGGDRYRAHRLFDEAGLHGDAVRVVRDDASPEGLAARAEAAEAGGDLVGAARVRVEAGDLEQAFELYQRAGEHAAAANCLRDWLGDEAAIEDPRLAGELLRAGDLTGLVTLCLEAIERRGRDTRAVEELRRLSSASQVPREMAPEVLAALDRIGANPRRGFEERAQAWVARARAETDRRFARIWGLDLGTTTCAVAIFDTELGKPVLCPWKGHDQFASTLSVDREGNELVGLAGEEIFASWLVGHIAAAKRAMGTRRVYRIRGRTYRPEEVAARLIQHARGLVESFLAARVRDRLADLARSELGEVHDDWLAWAEQQHDLRLDRPRAILTIPANFLNNQKQATRDACAIAGVEAVRLIHEPTAACISAARERRLTGRVVVVDLGAGTLDASYLEVDGNVYDVQQVVGDNHYGGKDFDAAITQTLVERLAARGLTVPDRGVARRRLEAAAEYLKIALSGRREADYTLLGFASGEDVRLELTRADLVGILAEPLQTLRQTCAELRASLKERADHLVLVGGPMLSPVVRDLVEQAFEVRRVPVADPRTAVALGAALQAAVLDGKLSELLLLDVTPLALGIRIVDESDATKDVFSVLVDANTTIPTERRKEYSTNEDNQTSVEIEIFNGQLDPVSKIGQFRLDGISPAPRGTPKIDVTFAIDASCVLEVTAQDRGTGRSNSIRVSDTTLLSPAEVEELARRRQRQEEWTATRERLRGLAAEAAEADSDPLWREFRDRQARYRPSGPPPDAATQRTLSEMYGRSGAVELELLLVQGPLHDLATKAREHLDREQRPDDDTDLAEARHLADALTRHLEQYRTLVDEVSRWNELLVRLAVAAPDPLHRFQALYRSDRFADALAALPKPPTDPADLHRYLHCLAETGDATRYRDLVGPVLGSVDPAAIVAVAVGRPSGRVTGTGFLVSDRLVVTNRHWLLDDRVPVEPARVTVGGAPIERIFLPEGSLADLAVLRLAAPSTVAPFRLGYPKLARVGDPVWTPAQGGVHGVIDAFETFPEEGLRLFRTGLRLPAEASGGPLLNDLGEVVGIVSINERSTGAFALTADALDPLLAQAGFSR